MSTASTLRQPYDLGPDFAQEGHGFALVEACALLAWGTSDCENTYAAEFGVGAGVSTAAIAKYLPVVGFDSFEGLPEAWREGYPKGALSFPAPTIDNAHMVPGWFEDTVPGYPFPDGLRLVHIDCDLYSSTVTVLTSLEPHLIPGVYIVFDEFHGYPEADQHEQKAWREFAARTGIEWRVVGHSSEEWALQIIGEDA